MENFLDFLKARRSIRRFKDQPIPKEVEQELFESIRWAQSWANTQCWEVVKVIDPETREALKATLAPRNPGSKAIVSAPILLVMCAKKKKSGYYNGEAPTMLGDWFLHDIGVATQNLALMAWAKGLASVVIGLFDHKKAGEILSVPEDVQVVSFIPVGYPDQSPKPPERKKIEEFVFIDKYGER